MRGHGQMIDTYKLDDDHFKEMKINLLHGNREL